MTYNHSIRVRFPVWKYLKQRIFDPQQPVILNPNRYWNLYQVHHLEQCWISQFRPEEHFRN